MVNDFKVGDQVVDSVLGNGEVKETGRLLWVWFEILGRGAYRRSSQLRPCSQEKHQHQFQVGDQVAHEFKGNGVVDRFEKTTTGKIWPVVKLESGIEWVSAPCRLRPREFLSKIEKRKALEKERKDKFNNLFGPRAVIGLDMADNPDVGVEAIVTPQGFKEYITDAYGIKRDPVTLLEIESDGLVQISSIKDTVRSIG